MDRTLPRRRTAFVQTLSEAEGGLERPGEPEFAVLALGNGFVLAAFEREERGADRFLRLDQEVVRDQRFGIDGTFRTRSRISVDGETISAASRTSLAG
jgi:hypothetical protein